MILARPICKVRDAIQVLIKQPEGEKVKITKLSITWSVIIKCPVTGNEGKRSSNRERKEHSSTSC